MTNSKKPGGLMEIIYVLVHSAMITNKIIWKIRFCFKMIGNGPKCAKIHIFQIFPWDFPMGALKIEVHPMGQWMAFLISGCCPDSKAVEILKIGWVCNSLPYLHMGLWDLSSTPYNALINSNMHLWVKCDRNLSNIE